MHRLACTHHATHSEICSSISRPLLEQPLLPPDAALHTAGCEGLAVNRHPSFLPNAALHTAGSEGLAVNRHPSFLPTLHAIADYVAPQGMSQGRYTLKREATFPRPFLDLS